MIKQTVKLKRIVRNYFKKQKEKLPQLVHLHRFTAAEDDDFINEDGWADEDLNFANDIADGIMPIYTNGVKATADGLGIGTQIDAESAPSQKFLANYSLNLARDINKTTKNDIKESIQTSLKLGENRNGLQSRLDNILDDEYRAKMIAQTESIRAFTQGRLDVGREIGYDQKQWNTQDGACEFCQSLDGQVIGIDDQFDGDIAVVDGPPLHPNCRCYVDLLKSDAIEGSEIKGGWITKNGEHILIDDSIGGDLPAVQRFENGNMSGSPEVARIFDKEGHVLNTTRGGAHNVELEEQREILKGAILSHNHPNGLSLSPDDMWAALHAEVAEVRAFTNEKVYSITFPKNYNFEYAISVFYAQLGKAGDLARKSGDISQGAVAERYARLAGLKYSVGKLTTTGPKTASEQSKGCILGNFVTMSKGGNTWVVDLPDDGESAPTGELKPYSASRSLTQAPQTNNRVSDIVKNSTGKTIGQIQREHEAAQGLGKLTEFQDALSANNFTRAESLMKEIQNSPKDSPLDQYKSTVQDVYQHSFEAGIGKNAFDLEPYKGLSQQDLNTAVNENILSKLNDMEGLGKEFNYSIKQIPINKIQDNIAADADKVDRYQAAMLKGDKFPPLVVEHFDGEDNLLDGAHRVEAVSNIGAKTITVLYGVPK